ncbi:MAG: hypothetical protein N3E50_06205 [Candidatus Goldbacteria bacterium]|nr:hypothetical protein [Candidatus Goldiibacteriota bacterium]
MIKKLFYFYLFFILFANSIFCDYDEAEYFYKSITESPEYSIDIKQIKDTYKMEEYKPNILFEDIITTSVESVAFGYFLTLAGIYIYEAITQGNFKPAMKTLDDYKPVYFISIGSFAAFNVFFNTIFYYKY